MAASRGGRGIGVGMLQVPGPQPYGYLDTASAEENSGGTYHKPCLHYHSNLTNQIQSEFASSVDTTKLVNPPQEVDCNPD